MPELPALTYRRVGHKGADLIAPGNTAASFDAAVAAGVDMIEFDVLPRDWRDPRGSELILAHDYKHDVSGAPTLEEGLTHLTGETFADIDLQVDLKWHGYEDRVVDALRRHGVIERTLVSSMYRTSLARIRAVEPALRLGWSVPHVKRDYSQGWTKLPAYGALLVYRRLLPRRATEAIRAGAIDALMAHWLVVTPRLVRAVADAGGDLYVWTVDDPGRIAELERLGVTGIISNDPRLFGPAAS